MRAYPGNDGTALFEKDHIIDHRPEKGGGY
jgi:hypothetical protein